MDPLSRPVVELLADRPDLVEAVTDLRWREWGHQPEPTDRDWWRDATIREAGAQQACGARPAPAPPRSTVY